MTSPNRVKVEGDLWHGRIPEGAVYVGRGKPGLKASPYANPHTLPSKKGNGCTACGGAIHSRDEVIELYRVHLDAHPELVDQARQDLAGHDLACWCKPHDDCHADIWLEILAAPPKEIS